ncbi:MAG: MraY family glycosyltransferase [Vulcanimicrobiota bacterium]
MLALPALSAFGLGFLLTLALTPWVKGLATRLGALDRPDARKVHKVPTPLWGGLGVSIAFAASLITVLALFTPPQAVTTQQWWSMGGLLVGGAALVALGMFDDRFGMAAKTKLLGQIGVALILVGCGVRVDYFSLPGIDGMIFLREWQAILLSMLWLVGVTNAINLLDGLDGLVAGVSLSSAVIFLVVAAMNGEWVTMVAMAAVAGAALGFLRYNFNPATIFLGDTGSLFLGLMFAGWSIVGCLKTTATVALAIPVMLILAVPILDTTFAIVRRGVTRQPIFKPDKGHLHHRLLAVGLSQRQAVCTIYAINVAFGLAGLAMAVFLCP